MAYGNRFLRTQGRQPVRIQVTNPSGSVYTIDPWMDSTTMTPWELTAAIRYFLDLKLALGRADSSKPRSQKPNRFIHVQRHT